MNVLVILLRVLLGSGGAWAHIWFCVSALNLVGDVEWKVRGRDGPTRQEDSLMWNDLPAEQQTAFEVEAKPFRKTVAPGIYQSIH